MGTLTNMERVSLDTIKHLKRHRRALEAYVMEGTLPEGHAAKEGSPRIVGFDKGFEDMCSLLGQLGYGSARSVLEYEGTQLHVSDFHCRYWRKTKLKAVVRAMRGTTQEELIAAAESHDEELTDWMGDPVMSTEVWYYLDSFDDMMALIEAAISNEEAILAVTG